MLALFESFTNHSSFKLTYLWALVGVYMKVSSQPWVSFFRCSLPCLGNTVSHLSYGTQQLDWASQCYHLDQKFSLSKVNLINHMLKCVSVCLHLCLCTAYIFGVHSARRRNQTPHPHPESWLLTYKLLRYMNAHILLLISTITFQKRYLSLLGTCTPVPYPPT